MCVVSLETHVCFSDPISGQALGIFYYGLVDLFPPSLENPAFTVKKLSWQALLFPYFKLVNPIILPPLQLTVLPSFMKINNAKMKLLLKSAWLNCVIDYYDKARNTPYFAPWHLGDKLGVYRWPQCNFKKRFYKSHGRLSKSTAGNRCRTRWTMQNVTNRNIRDNNKFGHGIEKSDFS